MPIPASSFLFAVCQAGAERALKQELAREHPELRPAYARRGLVTFRHDAGVVAPDFLLRSVFARAWGASIGPVHDAAEAVRAARERDAARLHVFERESWRPDETSREITPGAAASATRAALAAASDGWFREADTARPGERVLDVIVDPEGVDPWFLGWHVHQRGRVPWPGGRIPVDVPPEAPSRAYRKLEEALVWSGAATRLAHGHVAVEIGSAPGGASYALLRRGVRVVGVDPGEMDPIVRDHPSFTHLRVSLGDVRREALPPRVDWLLLDVNLAPQIALHQVRRLVAALRPTLRGLLFTLKLNEWRFAAEIRDLVRRVEAMGARARATQLPSNRQEIFLYGEVERRKIQRKR